jgi:hypothetical protein
MMVAWFASTLQWTQSMPRYNSEGPHFLHVIVAPLLELNQLVEQMGLACSGIPSLKRLYELGV